MKVVWKKWWLNETNEQTQKSSLFLVPKVLVPIVYNNGGRVLLLGLIFPPLIHSRDLSSCGEPRKWGRHCSGRTIDRPSEQRIITVALIVTHSAAFSKRLCIHPTHVSHHSPAKLKIRRAQKITAYIHSVTNSPSQVYLTLFCFGLFSPPVFLASFPGKSQCVYIYI